MNLKERIYYLIDKEGINPNQFYLKSGLGNGYLDKVGDSFRKPTIEKIKKAFPNWNMEWVISEKGEPFLEVLDTPIAQPPKMESSAVPISQEIVYIPLVNQYAFAGYVEGYNDVTYLDRLPRIPFIVDREGRGNYIAFEVKGDSMDDGTDEGYKEGEKLLCREIAPHLWVSSKLHLRKWDFVIIHEEGILVKRIVDHDVENHIITIHSLNDLYPDRKIDLCEVKQIFNVIESVRPRRR